MFHIPTKFRKRFKMNIREYRSLEEALKEPKKVLKLNLSYQDLTSLPQGIAKFEKLIKLNLNYNQLEFLPVEIGNLKKLTTHKTIVLEIVVFVV